MRLSDYEVDVLRTAFSDDPNLLMINGVMGLCGESGEVIDIVKKHLHQGHDLDKEHLQEELGDCLYYLTEVAISIGSCLEDIIDVNVEKRRKRYPNGFSTERSVNR